MRLRRNLDNDYLLNALQHQPVIDEGGLYLAAYWSWGEFVTPCLFKEMAAKCAAGEFPELSRLLRDTVNMDIQVQLVKRVPGSIAQVQRIHDKLVEKVNEAPEARFKWMESLQFPAPPLPGNEKIVPIETPAMLIEEGKMQHHCVAVMGYDIKEGKTYIYRILEPERATLAIDRILDGWFIGELRAACNAGVKGETLRMVQDWLDREQQGFWRNRRLPDDVHRVLHPEPMIETCRGI